jgi:hypothetical protein
MAGSGSKSNVVLGQLVANSLFTPRQLAIISKRLQGRGRAQNISSGAYYRQVKQCRDKVEGILYSVLVLQSIGVLQPEAMVTLGRLADQLGVIMSSDASDITEQARLADVISVMDALVKRMSKL